MTPSEPETEVEHVINTLYQTEADLCLGLKVK